MLRTVCDAYQELLRKEIPGDELRYYLSVGKAVYDLREISGVDGECALFIAGRIQYGTRRVYIADYMQCADALQSQSIHIPYETGRSLDSALERTDEAAMKQAIRDAFAFYRVTGQKNPTLCFAIARQIGEVLVQKLSQFGASPGKTRRVMEELETRLDNSDTEEQVQRGGEHLRRSGAQTSARRPDGTERLYPPSQVLYRLPTMGRISALRCWRRRSTSTRPTCPPCSRTRWASTTRITSRRCGSTRPSSCWPASR